MCEKACGKLPSSRPVAGSYSSESRPTSLRIARSRSKIRRASSCAALEREVVGVPERAGQERPLAGGEAVDVRLGLVAGDEPVGHQVGARSPRPSRRTRGSSAGRKPTSGIISRLASSCFDPYDWTNEFRARRRSPRGRPARGSASRTARQRSTGPSSRNCSTDLTARSNATQAITFEWVKCRRGPRTSQIPSSGCCQADLEEVEERRSSRQAVVERRQPAPAALVQRVDDLAVDVELELARRPRCRSAPAREPS